MEKEKGEQGRGMSTSPGVFHGGTPLIGGSENQKPPDGGDLNMENALSANIQKFTQPVLDEHSTYMLLSSYAPRSASVPIYAVSCLVTRRRRILLIFS